MESISAIGIFSSFIFALLLIKKKRKRFSDKILITWMFLFVIHLVLPLMMAIESRFFIEKINGLDVGLFTLHITFLYYYTLSLVNNRFKFELKHLLFLFPSATIYIVQYVIDANVELFSEIIRQHFFDSNILFHLSSVVFLNLLFSALFCQKLLKLLQELRKKIKDNYSCSEDIDLKWVQNLGIAALVLTFIAFLLLIALLKGKLNEEWLNNLYFASIIVFALVLGYWGYKQEAILEYLEIPSMDAPILKTKEPEQTTKQNPAKKGTVDPEELQSKLHKDKALQPILVLMKNEKPYLNPKLNIGTMANSLGIHAYQLSKLINQHFNQNFFEFVNQYRVEEFKNLASDPKNKHISIFGLALDAGFNSKATFNRIFKNATGQTPSQIRNNYEL